MTGQVDRWTAVSILSPIHGYMYIFRKIAVQLSMG